MEAGHALSSRLGRITISSEAIAQIVAETALECYGVVGMKGSLRGQIARARGRPRGIEIRGRGEAIALPTPLIRIHPERIVSWGIDPTPSARTVAPRDFR